MWLASRFTPSCSRSGRATSGTTASSSPLRKRSRLPSASCCAVTAIRRREHSRIEYMTLLYPHIGPPDDLRDAGGILADEFRELGRGRGRGLEAVAQHVARHLRRASDAADVGAQLLD